MYEAFKQGYDESSGATKPAIAIGRVIGFWLRWFSLGFLFGCGLNLANHLIG